MLSIKEIESARELLGVTKAASVDDIKKAYRTLVLSKYFAGSKSEQLSESIVAMSKAYVFLYRTQNGRQDIKEDEDLDIQIAQKEYTRFYTDFFEKKQPATKDCISEEQFQSILTAINMRMKEHEGWVYPGVGALVGISAPQIKRLLEHCSEIGGSDFCLDGQSLPPQVIVCLLRCLADYTLVRTRRCQLDLSNNSLAHPEVVEALIYFLDTAKSEWELCFNDCHLGLSDELARHLSMSKVVYSVSIEKNKWDKKHALGLKTIIEKNDVLEVLNFKGNRFDAGSLSTIVEGISKNKALRRLELSIRRHPKAHLIFPPLPEDDSSNILLTNELPKMHSGIHELPERIISACLKNPGLERLALQYEVVNRMRLELCITNLEPGAYSGLQYLELEGFEIEPAAITDLLTKKCTGLKSLFLLDCALSNETLKAIAILIDRLPMLQELYIDSTLGLHAGQAAIFNALSQNSTLKKLALGYLSSEAPGEHIYKLPQPEVVSALNKLFRFNKSLNELNIQACNVFSESAAKELAQTFKDCNRSVTRVVMHFPMPFCGLSAIENQTTRNYAALNPRTLVSKELSVARSEIGLSKEAFGYLMAQVKELVLKKSDTLQFKELQSGGSGLQLAQGTGICISQSQLEELLDFAFKEQFPKINCSEEPNLPVAFNALILKKIKEHYLNTTAKYAPLVALDFSNNDLSGCIPELISILSHPKVKLQTLHLAKTDMLPEELEQLALAIQNHPFLHTVSIDSNERIDYDAFVEHRLDLQAKIGSTRIEQMIRTNKGLRTLNLYCRSSETEKLSNILSALGPKYKEERAFFDSSKLFHNKNQAPETYNTHLESLSLDFFTQPIDPQLALVLKHNTHLKKLGLHFNRSFENYYQSLSAAFGSLWLTELSVSAYSFYRELSVRTAIAIPRESKLARITINYCVLDAGTVLALKAPALKALNLADNHLYADTHGAALLDVLAGARATLEELDLSNNCLGMNQNKKDLGEKSDFLSALGIALGNCPNLKALALVCPDNFSHYDSLFFMRRLKNNCPNLVQFNYYSPQNIHYSGREMNSELVQYTQFLAAEIQLKNQLLAKTNSVAEEHKESGWNKLEQLYLIQIEHLMNSIRSTFDKKSKACTLSALLGQEKKITWTQEHMALLLLLTQRNYAGFHTGWSAWKLEHGDTDETIDINLSILLDFVDESLLFYANSVRAFNVPGCTWVGAFPTGEVLFPAYETKLGILKVEEIKAHARREKEWLEERAAFDANNKFQETLFKKTQGDAVRLGGENVPVINEPKNDSCMIQ